MITVSKKSALSGETHERQIPLDPDAYRRWTNGYEPRFIQDAFPELGADDREFLLTGITPEEWDEAFGDGEDEDEPDAEEDCF